MKKANAMRGLSDTQLGAIVGSLPEGMALFDGIGRTVWANRLARRLFALRTTTSPDDEGGTELRVLVGRLIGCMPPFRAEEYVRWTVAGGGAVEVALRRIWGGQVAARLSPSLLITRPEPVDDEDAPLSTLQLIVAERLLEEAVVGLAVANGDGRIQWMNRQAQRLLGGAQRIGRDAQRDVARAARHVASGQLVAPIRMHLQLATRVVDAVFWSAAPDLAGVLFDGDEEEAARAPHRHEKLIA